MTEQEKELMKHFKVEELEERLEMKKQWEHDNCGSAGQNCPYPSEHPIV